MPKTNPSHILPTLLITILTLLVSLTPLTTLPAHPTNELTFISKSTGLQGNPSLDGGGTETELADVNQDGYLDILSVGDHGNPYVNTDEHGIMTWLGSANGTWTLHQNGAFGYGGCAIGDLNLDGHPDIAWGIHHDYSGIPGYGDTLIGAALGDGTGINWTGWATGLGTHGEYWGMFDTDFADFNNDGYLDLVSQSFGYGNGYHIYQNNGNGTWTHKWETPVDNTNNDLKTCDINADGNMDFIGNSYYGHVFLGDGTFNFTLTQTGLPSGTILGIDRGDINNDGCDDIVTAYDGQGVRAYLYDKPTNSWTPASTGLPTTGDYNVQCGDLNGDGNLDILAYSEPTAHAYLGDGTGTWTADATFTVNTPGYYAALRVDGDFDHDGREDVLIVDEEGGDYTSINVLRAYSPWQEPATLTARLKSPHGGETFKGGSTRNIRWLSAIPPSQGQATVSIALSLTGDQGPWQTIAGNLPDNGCYQWQVPGTGSPTCRIKITLTTSTETTSAISPADFTIIGSCIADAHGPYQAGINIPIQFNGSAANGTPPYSFHWMFGDGATIDEQNPVHTYTTAGNYSVSLRVIDSLGSTAYDSTWALVKANNTPPETPIIDGPGSVKVGRPATYNIACLDPENDTVFYYVDWGDNTTSQWTGPYASGATQNITHTWSKKGSVTIRCKAKDSYGAESPRGTLPVRVPLPAYGPLQGFIHWVLSHFPGLASLLSWLEKNG